MEEGKGEGVMEGSEDQTPDGLEKDEAGSKEGEEGEDVAVVTDSQLMAIAERLGSKWRQLATELSYAEDNMAQFENPDSDTTSALSMLSHWKVSHVIVSCVGVVSLVSYHECHVVSVIIVVSSVLCHQCHIVSVMWLVSCHTQDPCNLRLCSHLMMH